MLKILKIEVRQNVYNKNHQLMSKEEEELAESLTCHVLL